MKRVCNLTAEFLVFDPAKECPERILKTRAYDRGDMIQAGGGWYCRVTGKRLSNFHPGRTKPVRLILVRNERHQIVFDFRHLNDTYKLLEDMKKRRASFRVDRSDQRC